MPNFAVPNLYSRQRLADAEAEFFEMLKAVRQQQLCHAAYFTKASVRLCQELAGQSRQW